MPENENNSTEKEETNLVLFKPSGTEIVPFKKEPENEINAVVKFYRDTGKEFVNATADIAITALDNIEKINKKITNLLIDNAESSLKLTKTAIKGVKEVVELSGEIGKIFFKALWSEDKQSETKKNTSLIPINIADDKKD